jgi:hypothetical protein
MAYAPLAPGAEVAVYTAETQIKQSFEVVGIISYDNPGKYRIMDLGDAMDRLKEEARSVGGNGIIIDKSHPKRGERLVGESKQRPELIEAVLSDLARGLISS